MLVTSLIAKNSSGRGDEAPRRLLPWLRYVFYSHDLGRPSQRQVGRRSDEKDDALVRAGVLDLEVEIESLTWEMSTSIKQYHIVDMGSPQKPRSAKILGGLYLDAMTA